MKTQKSPAESPQPPSADDLAFEAELRARHPKRKTIRRFNLPSVVLDARAVYLAEMANRDTLRAAEMADVLMTDIERKSGQLTLEAERRESVRLAIVGVVDPDGTRRHVDQSKPFLEIDDWSSKAWSCLYMFHHDLNGIPAEEVKKAVASARTVGAVARVETPAADER